MQYIHQIAEVLPQPGQFFQMNLNFPELALQKRRSVLILDKDSSQEPVWRFLLEEADKDVLIHWATTVQEAEEAILDKKKNGESFDLMISELVLQKSTDGLDFWRKHGYDTPFIFTGHMSPKAFMRMLSSNEPVPVYLTKPLEARHCMDILRTVLDFHCAYQH